MKVRCIGFADSSRNKIEIEPWMDIGSVHSVIAVRFEKRGAINYGLFIGDIRKEWPSVVEFPSDIFEIVDGRLPRIWNTVETESDFYLWPKTWNILEIKNGIVEKDPNYSSIFADTVIEIMSDDENDM